MKFYRKGELPWSEGLYCCPAPQVMENHEEIASSGISSFHNRNSTHFNKRKMRKFPGDTNFTFGAQTPLLFNAMVDTSATSVARNADASPEPQPCD